MSTPAFLANAQGFHGSEGCEKMQAQPQAGNNWQFLSVIKVCQTGGAHLYSSNISPSHQKDKKKKIWFLRNRWDLWTLKAQGLKERGKKGSADRRHQIPLHRQHSKSNPSGESCSWYQPLLLSGSTCFSPMAHRANSQRGELKGPAWPGHFLLSQAHRKAKAAKGLNTGRETKIPCSEKQAQKRAGGTISCCFFEDLVKTWRWLINFI